MNKAFFAAAMIYASMFIFESAFAAKVCVIDNFGGYWELKGGKIDKKTYTVKVIFNGGASVCAGYADATKNNSGQVIVSIFNSHGANEDCNSVLWSAVTTLQFSGSGEYDILGDGSIDGTFTLAPISCSALPQTIKDVDLMQSLISNHPAFRKKGDQE